MIVCFCHTATELLFFQSVTLTLLRCNEQDELIKAVKEGIKSCLSRYVSIWDFFSLTVITDIHIKAVYLMMIEGHLWHFSIKAKVVNRGIKHDFPFINICKVLREVLKTEGEARGFQPSRGIMQMLMNDKIMFDRYYCINSAKHCENEENIGALYCITSSHFPTREHF